MEYLLNNKKKNILIHTKAWLKLNVFCQMEETRTQKAIGCIRTTLQKGKSVGIESHQLLRGDGGVECGLVTKRICRGNFRVIGQFFVILRCWIHGWMQLSKPRGMYFTK